MTYQVGVIVGSLRKQSLNRKLANAMRTIAPATLSLEIVEIGQLPLYNADDEALPAPAVAEFRRRIASLHGILFVTPEYNRGVPGALKNAIDIGSRPYGQSVWQGKPVGVISVSPGALGAFGANHQLRQSFVFLDMPAMQQPEAYIGSAAELFGPSGDIAEESTRKFIEGYLGSFTSWVAQHAAKASA